jgi:glyceraldehyde 3-phosphate dehydrogenase
MPDADATVVYGVNHRTLTREHRIISNASCTTNCLAPVALVLQREFGIESGQMTTIHAYTNDQHLVDTAVDDLYRGRAGALSMIPTKTGAAEAVGLVLPELAGRFAGMAVRVPTADVSLIDLHCILSRAADKETINAAMQAAADSDLKGVLAYNDEPLVSIDFCHHPASSIFDAPHTKVLGRQTKVMAWYDNEWGFSQRMVDVAGYLGNL